MTGRRNGYAAARMLESGITFSSPVEVLRKRESKVPEELRVDHLTAETESFIEGMSREVRDRLIGGPGDWTDEQIDSMERIMIHPDLRVGRMARYKEFADEYPQDPEPEDPTERPRHAYERLHPEHFRRLHGDLEYQGL